MAPKKQTTPIDEEKLKALIEKAKADGIIAQDDITALIAEIPANSELLDQIYADHHLKMKKRY